MDCSTPKSKVIVPQSMAQMHLNSLYSLTFNSIHNERRSNRHLGRSGKIMIDRRAVNEYLTLIGEKELPLNLFEIIDIEDRFPVERVNNLLNDKE